MHKDLLSPGMMTLCSLLDFTHISGNLLSQSAPEKIPYYVSKDSLDYTAAHARKEYLHRRHSETSHFTCMMLTRISMNSMNTRMIGKITSQILDSGIYSECS